MNPRLLFLPKFPEVSVQCPSCPFRSGNEKEFGEVLRKLTIANGDLSKMTKRKVCSARIQVYKDVEHRGDFMCHCSVYDENMKLKQKGEWRQCLGATEWFKKIGESRV